VYLLVQGQERRVIIISCVRSSPEHLKMDELYKLGFLRNPKRCVYYSYSQKKALQKIFLKGAKLIYSALVFLQIRPVCCMGTGR
jgi:hypothetical protein